ncbi:GIY-YIG nuclease family protein [Microbacterium paludicola]|uniref:GIY-YIG nuclease family protein n=1 Tax=Microbacterium paludicola TaxID=300019 RepID=UPI00387A3E51
MSSAFVYLLRCADGSLYCGSTRDLDKRLWEHQHGQGTAYTRRAGRRPVELAWFWELEHIGQAFHWEKQIQGWSRRKREALIEHGIDGVIGWSVADRERRNQAPPAG